jgi:hypothetical protein
MAEREGLMSAYGTHPFGAPPLRYGVLRRALRGLSNPRNPEGSLDFESRIGLFLDISARLKIHYILLY